MPRKLGRKEKPAMDGGRKSLRIQMTLPWKKGGTSVRLRVESGTTDRMTYHRYVDCLRGLAADPAKHHWLEAIQNGSRTVAEVFANETRGSAKASTPLLLQRVFPSVFDWLGHNTDLRPVTIDGMRYAFEILEARNPALTINGLHDELTRYRRCCAEAQTFAQFHIVRNAVLSYLKNGGFAKSAIAETAFDIRGIQKFNADKLDLKKREPNIPSIHDLLKLLPKFSRKYRDIVWSTYCHGLRPSEAAGKVANIQEKGAIITECSGHIELSGKLKTKLSNRDIPLMDGFALHPINTTSFGTTMKRVTGRVFQPKDLRRGYSRMLDLAGIPYYRQQQYLGHAAQSMTDIYKNNRRTDPRWRELESPERKAQRMAEMAEDRRALQNYIDGEVAKFNLSEKAA